MGDYQSQRYQPGTTKSFLKSHTTLVRLKRLKLETVNTTPPQTFPSGIIVGTGVAKTTGSLSVFLSEATTKNKSQHSEFIHSFYSILETRKQIKMVPGCRSDWITSQPLFSREISCPVADKIARVKQGSERTNLNGNSGIILKPLH